MLDSWQKDRKNRPKFAAVRNTIDRLMQSPELLRKLAKPMTSAMMDPEMPDVASHMTVSEWLQLIKMDRYTEAFAQKGVHTMEQVRHLINSSHFDAVLKHSKVELSPVGKVLRLAQSLTSSTELTSHMFGSYYALKASGMLSLKPKRQMLW